MIRTAAVIVRDVESPLRFAGLDLAERGIRLARKIGVNQISIVDDEHPFENAPGGETAAELVIVLPERTVLEPAALRALVARGLQNEQAAYLVDAAGRPTDVMLLSPEAIRC